MEDELKGIPIPSSDKELNPLSLSQSGKEEDAVAATIELLGETNTLNNFTKEIKGGDLNSLSKPLGIIPITGTKEKAVNSLLGMSSARKYTLFSSGINLAIKDREQPEVIALDIEIAQKQVEMGMDTLGLGFSNDACMVVESVINALKQNISVSTLKSRKVVNKETGEVDYLEVDDIFDYISIMDLQTIMLTALPEHFDIVRPCDNIHNDEPCNHVTSLSVARDNLLKNVDLTNLDENILTASKLTDEDVMRYRESLEESKLETITINGKDVLLELSIPSINRYIDSGKIWLLRVTKGVDKTLMTTNQTVKRNMLTNLYELNKMYAYAHFIKSVTIGDDTLTDLSDIFDTIELMCNKDSNRVMDTVGEMVRDSTNVVVGLPAFKCEKCKAVQTEDETLMTGEGFVSLNMVKVFLDFTNLKLMNMAS